MKSRIVLGIDAWYPQVDGVTNVVLNYRDALQNLGNECEIVAPSYGAEDDAEGERNYCAGVFHNRSLAVPFLGFRNSTPGSDRKLKKMLLRFRPQILHAHSPFAICAYFVKYGKKHNVPVIYTFHTKFKDEFLRVTHSRLITAVMMKIIMRNINRVSYVWAVSESSAQTLREYGYRGEIRVMRSGTDMQPADSAEIKELAAEIDDEYGLSAEERVLMYSGRVVSVKNLRFSFSVLSELKNRGFKCKFFIVGGGEELEAHKKLAERMGITDMTVFTGFIGDRQKLRKFYARADLMLFPSTFDTFGLVIQEAAACRTPSMVPENSGAAEIIRDGIDGYVVKLAASLWADRIEQIFSDGNRSAVCSACASLVYTWKSAVDSAAAEYERVIKDFSIKTVR